MGRNLGPAAERFRLRVDTATSGCWLWQGAQDANGYGRFKSDYGVVLAHRFAYELWVGPVGAGLCVLHRCDTPACVRPDHLFVGTKADNTADMMAKGRNRNGSVVGMTRRGNHYELQARGEKIGAAKMTADSVRNLRTDRAGGLTMAQLADKYGLSMATVHSIVHRRYWAHI